jgi:hypothetical protein
MLSYEDLVVLAMMCARNARQRRATKLPKNYGGWRRNIRPKLASWVAWHGSSKPLNDQRDAVCWSPHCSQTPATHDVPHPEHVDPIGCNRSEQHHPDRRGEDRDGSRPEANAALRSATNPR